MNNLVLLGGILGFALFYPLCKQILKKKVVQNPLTFFLWSLLDGISAGAMFLEGGNYLQAMLFCIGGIVVVFCTISAKNPFKWTWFESFIAISVLICICVWIQTDNTTAAIVSLTALCIASVPQIKDAWNMPEKMPTLIYFGYTVSHVFAMLGGKEISIIEIGYPFLGFVVCFTVFLFSLQKPKTTMA